MKNALALRLWFSLFGVLGASVANGQEEDFILVFEDEESASPAVVTPPEFVPTIQFRGNLTDEVSLDARFEEDERILRSFHRLGMDAEIQLKEALKARVSGRMTYWVWARSDRMDHYAFEPELMDTYLHWDSLDIVSGTVGMQTFSWGPSDFFPTQDLLNPRDLRTGPSSGLETPKIPVFGLTLSRGLGDFVHVEGVWLPFYAEDKRSVMATDYGLVGGGGSAAGLTGSLGFLMDAISPGAVDDVDGLFFGLNRPDEGLENSAGGIRLTGNLGAVDLGLSYQYGWDATPELLVSPCLPTLGALLGGGVSPEELDVAALAGVFAGGEALSAPVDGTCSTEFLIQQMFSGELALTDLLQTRVRRRQTLGGDLVIPIGEILVRLDTSWSPERVVYDAFLQSLRKPSLSSTVGLEYSYESSLTLSTEFNYARTFGIDRNRPLFLARGEMIQAGAVLAWRGLEYDALEVQWGALYGITMKEWILLPSVGYRIADGFLVQLGARILEGEPGSAGKMYDQNDEVYVLSRWDF